jgi:hypothetical protein
MNMQSLKTRSRARRHACALCLLGVFPLGLATACDPAVVGGSVEVTVTGEEAATEGLPFSEDGETIAFSDGDWTVTFERYVVALRDITVGDASIAGPFVVDLSRAEGEPPAFSLGTLEDLPAGRATFGFAIDAADADATVFGDVTDDELAAMADAEASYWVKGTATDGADTVSFDWLLGARTTNSDCTNGVDDTQGVVVAEDATVEAEITVHIEHVFYDTLGVEGPGLVMDPMVALAGEDGVVTTDELAAADIDPTVYDRGSYDVDDMLGFITVSASSQAHLNGEGLCTLDAL